MIGTAILWPTIAMAALVFAVSQVLLFQRMAQYESQPAGQG